MEAGSVEGTLRTAVPPHRQFSDTTNHSPPTQLGKKGSFSMGRLPPLTDEIANSTMALPELAQLAAARSIIATVPLLM